MNYLSAMRCVRSVCYAIALIVIFSQSLSAQRITRISPSDLNLRAIAAPSTYLDSFSLVIAVGDSGCVIQSINGGANWDTLRTSIPKSATLFGVASSYRTDSTYIDAYSIIVGSGGTMFRRAGGDILWKQIDLGTHRTIRAVTANNAGVFVAAGDSGMVIRSTDYGATWSWIQLATTRQLNAISFGTPSAGVIVGNDTAIYQTVDSGKTWSMMPFPYTSLPSMVKHIDFPAVAMAGADSILISPERPVLPMFIVRGEADPFGADPNGTFSAYPNSGPVQGIIYIGLQKLFAWVLTTDDLSTICRADSTKPGLPMRWSCTPDIWTADADGTLDHGSSRFHAATMLRNDTFTVIFLVGLYGDIHEFISTDSDFIVRNYKIYQGFSPYVLQPLHGLFTNYLDVEIPPGSPLGACVGSGGDIQFTSTGGLNWGSGVYIDSILNSVAINPDTVSVACGWGGSIVKSKTNAYNRTRPDSHTTERLHSVVFTTPSNCVIVGDYGYTARSTDTGNTWKLTQIPPNLTVDLKAVAFVDPNVGVCGGTNGTILRTTDGGQNWEDVNPFISGTPVVVRRLQAFPNGTILAQATDQLIESTDAGQNWLPLNSPGDSLGMSFYNRRIGIVATRASSSAFMLDTAFLSYTTDGGANWTPITVHIANGNRILFHWRNDHQVLLFGIEGWTVQLDIPSAGVTEGNVKPASILAVFPNPSNGDVRVEYNSVTSGPVTIELWDEAANKVETLLAKNEDTGKHSHVFSLSQNLHGAFFIRVLKGGESSSTPFALR